MAFIYNLTDNWTDSATTWNGIKLAVTNTASSASSNLLNLTVTGATTASFVVDKSGNLALNGTVNKITFTAPATGATLTLADNSTFATVGGYSTTFTFSGATSLTFPTSGTVTALGNTTTGTGDIVLSNAPTMTLTNATGLPVSTGISGLGSNVATWLATPSSANLALAVTGETGSGALVFATSPTLVTPDLGTPSAAALTNATGLPISTGVSGLGSGVATFLATPSSANLAAAVTDETGTGSLVFSNSPTFNDDITLGVPSTTRGELILANTTANTVNLRSSNSTAASYTLTLPAASPVNGYYLQTDVNGVLSWAAGGGGGGGSPGGSNTQIQFNNAGAFGGDAAFTFVNGTGTATTTLGVASTTSGALKLYNSASANSVTVASGNNTAAWTMTLPPDDGSSGQYLQTDGSGNTSWATVTAGDVVGPASATDNAVVRFDGTTGKLIQDSAVTIADTTGDITAGKYNGLTVTTTTGTLTVANGKTLAADNSLTFTGTDGSTVNFGAGGTATLLGNTTTGTGSIVLSNSPTFNDDITLGVASTATGAVKFTGTTSGLVTLSVADAAGTWTLKLPTTAGSAGQYLQTDGSGNATWASVSGTGDVSGPASATDNAIVRFDGTTGKLVQNSAVTIADTTGDISTSGTLAMGSSFLRNRLINGNFSVAQRGTSFTSTGGANNDDTYNLDRWYILSDGNDAVDITQATDVPANGSKYSIGLDVETINKKFGIAQIIENINCQELIGNTVSLSFKAKVSSTTKLDNIKAAVIAWSGTADTVTSDIISAWGAEGTNPTLASNLTYENTPANLNVTTGWATYKIENVAVDTANTTNIIVFIWSDVTDTTLGDFLYITDVQIERGTVATPFERRQFGQELALCQRYYWRATGTATGAVGFPVFAFGQAASATTSNNVILCPSTFRAVPTVSYAGTINVFDGSASATLSSVGTIYGNPPTGNVWAVLTSTGSNLTVGRATLIYPQNASTNWIDASAEL